jgi:predicted RNase H-like HicB family nuclease
VAHYVAIIDDEGPDFAIGVRFPDLPGCFSAGDTIEEGLADAEEAVAVYAEVLADEGRPLPAARSLFELKRDAAFRADSDGSMIALVSFREPATEAAE